MATAPAVVNTHPAPSQAPSPTHSIRIPSPVNPYHNPAIRRRVATPKATTTTEPSQRRRSPFLGKHRNRKLRHEKLSLTVNKISDRGFPHRILIPSTIRQSVAIKIGFFARREQRQATRFSAFCPRTTNLPTPHTDLSTISHQRGRTPLSSGVPSRRGAAKPRGTKAPAFVNTRQVYPTAELYV